MTASLAGLRVVVYTRFSSEAQRDASIEDQARVCTTWVAERGGAVAEVLADRGLSGTTTARPALQQLLAMARSRPRRLDVVVLEDLSRLGRDQADVLAMLRDMRELGVRVCGVRDGIDTAGSSSVARTLATLHGLQAELYVEQLSERTRRGLEGRALAGMATGALPIGYRAVAVADVGGRAVGKTIVIDEPRAAIVRRIFALYLAGESLGAIAQRLTAEGVEPPRSRRRMGPGWVITAVRAILQNDKYSGRWAWGARVWKRDRVTGKRGYTKRAAHEVLVQERPDLALVDATTWTAVRARLDAVAARFRGETTSGPTQRRTQHPLSGLLFCDACGARLELHGWKAGYYRCAASRRGACRERWSIRSADIRASLVALIEQRLATPEIAADMHRAAVRSIRRITAAALEGLDRRRTELARTKAAAARLVDRIAEGLDTPAMRDRLVALERESREHAAGVEEMTAIAAAAGNVPTVEQLLERARAFVALIDQNPTGAREALRSCFEGGGLKVRREAGKAALVGAWRPVELLRPLRLFRVEVPPPAAQDGPEAAGVSGGCGGEIRPPAEIVRLFVPIVLRRAA